MGNKGTSLAIRTVIEEGPAGEGRRIIEYSDIPFPLKTAGLTKEMLRAEGGGTWSEGKHDHL